MQRPYVHVPRMLQASYLRRNGVCRLRGGLVVEGCSTGGAVQRPPVHVPRMLQASYLRRNRVCRLRGGLVVERCFTVKAVRGSSVHVPRMLQAASNMCELAICEPRLSPWNEAAYEPNAVLVDQSVRRACLFCGGVLRPRAYLRFFKF